MSWTPPSMARRSGSERKVVRKHLLGAPVHNRVPIGRARPGFCYLYLNRETGELLRKSIIYDSDAEREYEEEATTTSKGSTAPKG